MNTNAILPWALTFLAGGSAIGLDLPDWARMWLFTAAMFFCVKALVMQRTGLGGWKFVLLWPGMDARAFERIAQTGSRHHHSDLVTYFLRGLGNLTTAVLIAWIGSAVVTTPFWTTWLCMIALILALHCGIFTLLAAFWRLQGRHVKPIMHTPLLARSVTEFWGERWNLAFSDAALQLVVRPLHHRLGRGGVMALVFAISGLAHELAISVPARGGFGGPFIYFMIQAAVVGLERGCTVRMAWFWRLRAWITLVVPLPLLIHEPFVMRVMYPFFQDIHLSS